MDAMRNCAEINLWFLEVFELYSKDINEHDVHQVDK